MDPLHPAVHRSIGRRHSLHRWYQSGLRTCRQGRFPRELTTLARSTHSGRCLLLLQQHLMFISKKRQLPAQDNQLLLSGSLLLLQRPDPQQGGSVLLLKRLDLQQRRFVFSPQ